MRTRLAIFDIDHTVIRKDSMLLLLGYGLRRRPWTAVHLPKVLLHTVFYKLRLLPVERAKAAFYYTMRYMSHLDLEQFYDEVLVPAIYEDARKELQLRCEQGYHVLLVSASPYAYVRYFEKLPYVHGVIGTTLEERQGGYQNRIVGANNKGEEKVRRVRQYLAEHGLELDGEQSCAYSDSLSDQPLFRLVKHGYLINRTHPEWEVKRWR